MLCSAVQIYVPRETCWPCIPLFRDVVNTSIFPDFCMGLYTNSAIPPGGARPPPATAAQRRAHRQAHIMMQIMHGEYIEDLRIHCIQKMPYESMTYKTLETDSKSGRKSGFTSNHCHILNDNALPKRPYI